MTYSEFLSFIKNGIDLFTNNIGAVANYLITNYFFITILGLVIFYSLFVMFIDFVLEKIYSKRPDLDSYLEKKKIERINSQAIKDSAESISTPPIETASSSELHK